MRPTGRHRVGRRPRRLGAVGGGRAHGPGEASVSVTPTSTYRIKTYTKNPFNVRSAPGDPEEAKARFEEVETLLDAELDERIGIGEIDRGFQ